MGQCGSVRCPPVLLAHPMRDLCDTMAHGLESHKLNVITAHKCREAVSRIVTGCFSLVILHNRYVDGTAQGILEVMRGLDKMPPVVVLNVDGPEQEARFFDEGVFDVVNMPFDFNVLVARLRSAMRKSILVPTRIAPNLAMTDEPFVFAGRLVDPREGTYDGRPMRHRVLGLMRLFAQNEGRVISREEFYRTVWDGTLPLRSRCLDQYIISCRKAIDCRGIIECALRQGYRYRSISPVELSIPTAHVNVA